jgi:Rod binding domain-containing protein
MSAEAMRPIGEPSGVPSRADLQDKLRRTAQDFQAVFLARMFQAMHDASVPSSLTDPSQGEQTFRFLLDDRLAREASVRMTRGLGEDLYRALCRRLPEGALEAEQPPQ